MCPPAGEHRPSPCTSTASIVQPSGTDSATKPTGPGTEKPTVSVRTAGGGGVVVGGGVGDGLDWTELVGVTIGVAGG